VPSLKHTSVPMKPGWHSHDRDFPIGEHEAASVSSSALASSPQPTKTGVTISCDTRTEILMAHARNGRMVGCV
jgi:hypothetical protein